MTGQHGPALGRFPKTRERRAASEMEALLAAAESEFGGLLPRLKADLDAFEASIREGLLACGAKGYAALLEALDAELPTPCCRTCGEPMERHSRCGKTFQSRFGPLRIEWTYCRCRKCGGGCFPLDIALGLVGKKVTPRAESLCADVASSDSCEAASRKCNYRMKTPQKRRSKIPQCGDCEFVPGACPLYFSQHLMAR